MRKTRLCSVSLLLLKTFQTKCKSCLEVHFGMQNRPFPPTFQVYTPQVMYEFPYRTKTFLG